MKATLRAWLNSQSLVRVGYGTQQRTSFHAQSLSDFAQHGYTGRDIGALDRADITVTKAGPVGQPLLGHVLFMADMAQVEGNIILQTQINFVETE